MYKITHGGLTINVDETELIRFLTYELGYSNDGASLIKGHIDSGVLYDAQNVSIVKA